MDTQLTYFSSDTAAAGSNTAAAAGLSTGASANHPTVTAVALHIYTCQESWVKQS